MRTVLFATVRGVTAGADRTRNERVRVTSKRDANEAAGEVRAAMCGRWYANGDGRFLSKNPKPHRKEMARSTHGVFTRVGYI